MSIHSHSQLCVFRATFDFDEKSKKCFSCFQSHAGAPNDYTDCRCIRNIQSVACATPRQGLDLLSYSERGMLAVPLVLQTEVFFSCTLFVDGVSLTSIEYSSGSMCHVVVVQSRAPGPAACPTSHRVDCIAQRSQT